MSMPRIHRATDRAEAPPQEGADLATGDDAAQRAVPPEQEATGWVDMEADLNPTASPDRFHMNDEFLFAEFDSAPSMAEDAAFWEAIALASEAMADEAGSPVVQVFTDFAATEAVAGDDASGAQGEGASGGDMAY